MNTSKPDIFHTANQHRCMCSKYTAAAIGILSAAVLLYFAYTMEYVIFHQQISLIDIMVLIVVLFVIATLTGLVFYKMIQSVGSRSDSAYATELASTPFAEAPIIDQPVLQKPVVRGLELLVSVTVWGLFLYLFQSLFTAVFWIFGGRLIYSHVFSQEAIEGTKNMLAVSMLFAVIMFSVMFLWASWNYWRFGRLERRTPRPPVPDEVVAGFYGVPVSFVHTAKLAKVARVLPQAVGMDFTIETAMPSEK